MNKKFLLGTVAVFIVWQVLDYLIHGVLLMDTYTATADMWRPEMNMGLLMVVGLIAAAAFVYIYAAFVGNQSTATALKYGLVYGIGAGVSMGYGSYAVMDIPYNMALIWFLGAIVEALAGAYAMSLVVKPEATATATA